MYLKSPTPEEIPAQYIDDELNKIEQSFKIFDFIPLTIWNAEPDKPQVGIYAADGTNWNPGSGGGVYYYNGSTFIKL